MDTVSLGSALKRLRQAAGLTQRELSDRLGVKPTYISHLEADRKEPSVSLLRRFASHLEVPPGLLLAIAIWADLPEPERVRYEPILKHLVELSAPDAEV